MLEDNIPFNAIGDRQSHRYPIKSHLYSWLQSISAYANGVKLSPELKRKGDFKLNEKMCLSSTKKMLLVGDFLGLPWIGKPLEEIYQSSSCVFTRVFFVN